MLLFSARCGYRRLASTYLLNSERPPTGVGAEMPDNDKVDGISSLAMLAPLAPSDFLFNVIDRAAEGALAARSVYEGSLTVFLSVDSWTFATAFCSAG